MLQLILYQKARSRLRYRTNPGDPGLASLTSAGTDWLAQSGELSGGRISAFCVIAILVLV